MPAAKKRTQAEIEQRQAAPLVHGGAGAEKALSTGAEFTNLAHDAELSVRAELDTAGVVEVYKKRAARLQAAADLYWAAILGSPDMVRLDSFMQRWGWLQASALRAWQAYRELEKTLPAADITTILQGKHGD